MSTTSSETASPRVTSTTMVTTTWLSVCLVTTFGTAPSRTMQESIHVIYGTQAGLGQVGDQLIDRSSSGIEGNPVYNDRFGAAVAVGDFNCDNYEDVAIGVPWDDAESGRYNDGSINVIYGTSNGLTSVDDFFHQGTANVSGNSESADQFGSALAVGNFNGTTCDDLAVGAAGENNDGGYVVFFYGAISWSTNFTYSYPNFGTHPEHRRHLGHSGVLRRVWGADVGVR